MLKALFGTAIKEKVLLSILVREEAYARELAVRFDLPLLSVQNQLKNLESGGVLVSRSAGRTRLYTFNPRYPFLKELTALLRRTLDFMTRKERSALTAVHRRPRRAGKPL